MGVDGQLKNFWSLLFSIGAVCCGNQIAQSEDFTFIFAAAGGVSGF